MLDMKHLGELGSHQLAINQALQNGVPFSWLKEFTEYFNGKEWVRK